MRRGVTVTTAFGVSGLAWLAGFCLLNPDLVDPELSPVVPLAAGYVGIGSVLLGARSQHLRAALSWWWAAAVALLFVVLGQSDPAPALLLAAAASLLYGTLAFVAWVALAFVGMSLLGEQGLRDESRPRSRSD